jgi:hypothetical protein
VISSLRYALRNLLRSTRRTALTMSAIVAGVGVYIVGEGFVSGLSENVVSAATEGTVGHVLARPASYPRRPGQYPIDALLDISSDARAFLDQHTASWTTRTYFTPLAVAGRSSLRVIGIGYDPARDARVFPREHWTIRGHMPEPQAAEVAVSARVAHLLALDLGAPIVLETRTHRGAMNALEVKLWMYLPTLDRVQKVSGHMLRQGLMGSDVSYEDLMVSRELRTRYAAKLTGDSTVDGRSCWLLEMVSKDDSVTYPKRISCVDKVNFIPLQQELFALSGTLLKTWHMSDLKEFPNGRRFPTKMVIQDDVKKRR